MTDCGLTPPEFNSDLQKVCIDKPESFPVQVSLTDHGWIIGDSIVDYGSQSNLASEEALLTWMSATTGFGWFEENGRFCGLVDDPELYGELLTSESCFIKLFDFTEPLEYIAGNEGVIFEDELINFPEGQNFFETKEDVAAWANSTFAGNWTIFNQSGGNYTLGGFVPCEDVCKYQGRLARDANWQCIAENLTFPYRYSAGDGIVVDGEIKEFGSGTFQTVSDMVEAINELDDNNNGFQPVQTGETWSICASVTSGEYKGVITTAVNPCCCLYEEISFPFISINKSTNNENGELVNIPRNWQNPEEFARWWTETSGVEFFAVTNDFQTYSICTNEYQSCDELPIVDDTDNFTGNLLEGPVQFPLNYQCSRYLEIDGLQREFFPDGTQFDTPEQMVSWLSEVDPEVEYYFEKDEFCVYRIFYRTNEDLVRTLETDFDFTFRLDFDRPYPCTWGCDDGLVIGRDFVNFGALGGEFASPDDIVSALQTADPDSEYSWFHEGDCRYSIFVETFDPQVRDLIWPSNNKTRVCEQIQFPVTRGEGSSWVVNTCDFFYVEDDGDGTTNETLKFATGAQEAEFRNSNDPNGIEWTSEHLGNGLYEICADIPGDLLFMY